MSDWMEQLEQGAKRLKEKEKEIFQEEIPDPIHEKLKKTIKRDSSLKRDIEELKRQLQETIVIQLNDLKQDNKELREFKDHIMGITFDKDEIWDLVVSLGGGQIRNWLTQNQPKSKDCKRTGALNQLVVLFNQILNLKIKGVK